MNTTTSVNKKEILFHGIPASPGIAIAPVRLIDPDAGSAPVSEKRTQITQDQVDQEIDLFSQAVASARDEIRSLRDSLQGEEAQIFDAHLLIASDRMLANEVTAMIRKRLFPAERAFTEVIDRYVETISNMPDKYFRERATDIRDVAKRIGKFLSGMSAGETAAPAPTEPEVIIARDLTPSDTATLDRTKVLGFAIETGSTTSHTAIVARSMKLPAVVGMQRLFNRLENGDRVIIDGYLGMVVINPEPETIAFYEEKIARQNQLLEELQKESSMTAETLDGYQIHLAANVEGVDGLDEVIRSGAAGIGLFRTEYLFMNKSVLPDEETQFKTYRLLAERMQGQPVIIRTLDVGGDKISALLTEQSEPNPFLGLRAIRLSMSHPELMRTQMRAILRAARFGNIKILFPMISSVGELDSLLAMLEDVKEALKAEQIPYSPQVEIGVMIEVPAAALIADQLAEKVDFFSIGSNDLVQYTLAVDRTNEKVAHLYNPMHPAVIELIARAAKAARDHHIWIGCCGELAGYTQFTPLLVGLGIQEFSMSCASLAPVRRVIRRLSRIEAEKLVEQIRSVADPQKAMELCQEFLVRIAPDVAKMNKGF